MPFEKLLPMGAVIPTQSLPADAARDNFFARQRCGARSSRFAPHSFGLSRLWPETVRALRSFLSCDSEIAMPAKGLFAPMQWRLSTPCSPVWAFVASFSERLVPDLLNRIAKKTEWAA